MLPDAKVTSPPRDFLSESQQTAGHTGYRTLASLTRRGHMQLNAARQIEGARNGRADFGRKLNHGHNGSLLEVLEWLASCEKIKYDGSDQDEDGSDPPDRLHPGWLERRSELPADEIVIVEILVRQIDAIVSLRVLPPAGIVVCPALRAGARAARDILTANGTHVRRFEIGSRISGHCDN